MDRHISAIRIFDENLNFLGEVDNFTSLLFTRRWDTYGEFEFHVTDLNRELIKKGNIIMVDNDESKCGIIEYIEINEEQGDDIKVKGFSLLYLLTFRLVIPVKGDTQIYKSYADEIMINLVKDNALSAGDRKIEILRADENILKRKNRGEVFSFSGAYTNLCDEITNLCRISGLGASINFNIENQCLIFKVLEGRNLSAEQEVNPPAIFSVSYDNVKKQTYIESSLNYKNCAYVENGSGNPYFSENKISGLKRREIFIKNEQNNNDLAAFAKLKLKDNEMMETYECEVDPAEYKETWDLGDIVTTVSKKYGFVLNNRVSEVKEVYENNTINVEPTFGSIIPTILDEVKKSSAESGKAQSSLGVVKA